MTQVAVNFRMDKELKNDMEKICKEMGLSMTAAFTIFAKKLCRERRIPFEITADPFYSDENISRLKASIAQMEKTGGTVHLDELEDMELLAMAKDRISHTSGKNISHEEIMKKFGISQDELDDMEDVEIE